MKKAMLLAGLGLTVFAISCKKDDKTKTPKEQIVGTWNHIYYAEDANDNGKIDESEKEPTSDAVHTFEFKADGTVTQTIKVTTGATPTVVNGTYSISEDGKKMTVSTLGFSSSSDVETLNANELFFSIPKNADFNKQWNYLTK